MTNKSNIKKRSFFSFYNPNELKFEPSKDDGGMKKFSKMYQKLLEIRYKKYGC